MTRLTSLSLRQKILAGTFTALIMGSIILIGLSEPKRVSIVSEPEQIIETIPEPTPEPTPEPEKGFPIEEVKEEPKIQEPVKPAPRFKVYPIYAETKIAPNGMPMCEHKKDKPHKSDKNPKWSPDHECCLDPYEIPNGACYYPQKYDKLIKKYFEHLSK